jgi:tRNA G46 methylase TrmB
LPRGHRESIVAKERKQMIFEALDRDGEIKMSTDNESCVYPAETLLEMQKAGYTFRLDGKVYKPTKRKKEAEQQ